MPTPDELATPPFTAAITVSGQVTSRDGRFHPRLFTVPLNADRIAYVPLYRSAVTTRFDEAGGLAVSLRYADGAPAAWAVATLTCTRTGKTFTFSGQANERGDLLVAMRGLPPPPASSASDQMTMTVVAPAAAADRASRPADRRVRLTRECEGLAGPRAGESVDRQGSRRSIGIAQTDRKATRFVKACRDRAAVKRDIGDAIGVQRHCEQSRMKPSVARCHLAAHRDRCGERRRRPVRPASACDRRR